MKDKWEEHRASILHRWSNRNRKQKIELKHSTHTKKHDGLTSKHINYTRNDSNEFVHNDKL